jgi:hypothetical protein
MSTVKTVEVSKGRGDNREVLATLEVEQYDSIKEAKDSLGEEKALNIINQRLIIVAQDNKRRELTGGGGTGTRALMAALKAKGISAEDVAKKLGISIDG